MHLVPCSFSCITSGMSAFHSCSIASWLAYRFTERLFFGKVNKRETNVCSHANNSDESKYWTNGNFGFDNETRSPSQRQLSVPQAHIVWTCFSRWNMQMFLPLHEVSFLQTLQVAPRSFFFVKWSHDVDHFFLSTITPSSWKFPAAQTHESDIIVLQCKTVTKHAGIDKRNW